MKTTTSILASLLLLSSIFAQEASIESPKPETGAAAERQRKLQAEEKAKALLEKKAVVSSGFLVEAARAEKKSRLFSLRQPRDPRNDVRNVSYEERTGKPRGFVLLRLEF